VIRAPSWLRVAGPADGSVVAHAAPVEHVEGARAEAPPEALRLGAETPSTPAAWSAPAPPTATLRDVARIGDHLGALERQLAHEPELAWRVARARILADLAAALADLREQARVAARAQVRA
jgi:hypothetical protein